MTSFIRVLDSTAHWMAPQPATLMPGFNRRQFRPVDAITLREDSDSDLGVQTSSEASIHDPCRASGNNVETVATFVEVGSCRARVPLYACLFHSRPAAPTSGAESANLDLNNLEFVWPVAIELEGTPKVTLKDLLFVFLLEFCPGFRRSNCVLTTG